MNKTEQAFDLEAAPMRIGRVRLKVHDRDRVAAFYRAVIGLVPMAEEGDAVVLGTGSTALLELIGDRDLLPRDPRAAGLFHTAFLLPGRRDLARWLRHAAHRRVPLEGASDHLVSEAVYLSDPEGNGIEVYADRPPSRWRDGHGNIRMATESLDVAGLAAEATGGDWTGFPEDGCVGHVHLQAGDTGTAEAFYRDLIGLDVSSRYPGASFFGSGGYHHQLAANVWNSRGAGPRPEGMAGLEGFELVFADQSLATATSERARAAGHGVSERAGHLSLRDPWGTAVNLTW